MSKKESFWRSCGGGAWIVIFSIAVAAIAVVAILSQGFRSFVANDVTAAWVQALGSILALWVAVYLANVERIQRREERADDLWLRDVAYFDDVAGIALELHARIVQLRAVVDADTERSYYVSEILFFKDLLSRLAECTQGYAPKAQKNLSFEIRRLIAEVLNFVTAQAISNYAPAGVRPDWERWTTRGNDLFEQANAASPAKPGT